MAKKKYLITGGLGLIGSTLANSLQGEVIVVARNKKNKDRIIRNDVTYLFKPFQKLTEKELQGVDIIFHCASTVDNYTIQTDPYADVKTNIEGTISLLETIKTMTKKPKIIYLSTFFVYGHEHDRTQETRY